MRRSSKFLNIVLLLTVIAVPFSCAHQENRSNLIQVEPEDSFEEIVRKSTLVVPSERQYDWQQLEFIAFLHFGPNTFTGVEWGNGMEDPTVFNPTEFDASQWVSVIKDAGMKLAMLTAKHHDGFCLWPTTTTDHSVKNSPWKNGKGDVLGELVEAARAENIEIGVYLSPADLHEIERPNGTYGNGSEPKTVKIPSDSELQKTADQIFEYELDDYDALFMNQLYEVLTQYGPIEEVWFDGANPKPGTGQTYNRKAWYDMIRKLQPEAVIAIKGPDVRWCGNEAGHTRKSEWSVLPVPEHPDNYNWPDLQQEDLGSREKLADAKYLYWYPAETNTSIRHGWFYRDDEQYVKTVEELVDTWYRSVGGNTVFLLNLTPDRRGLIPEKDAERLREVGRIIAASFEENLALNAEVEASDKKTSPENILDGNAETFWKPANGNEQAELILTLEGEKEFNRLVLQECIKNQGQRIERFAFDIWKNEDWKEVSDGTVVGYKNIRRFPMVKAEKVRLRILESRLAPTIATFGLYKAPEMLSNPAIYRNKECGVTIRCQTPDPVIHYTLDGSEPNAGSLVYENPFELPGGGVVKAIAMTSGDAQRSEVVEARFDICPANWTVEEVSAQHSSYLATNVIDGNPSTMWHTPWGDSAPNHPHSIIINFGETLALKGFSYLPRTDGQLGGVCKSYKVEVSEDGTTWKLAKQGAFDNIRNSPVLQEIRFGNTINARYLRFTSLSNVNGSETLSVAEIGVITRDLNRWK
jgi:alpha-L-fucosidase